MARCLLRAKGFPPHFWAYYGRNCRLGKAQPKPQEYLPTATLDRHSPHFSDDKSLQGWNPSDLRGIEMESEMMMVKTAIGQDWR
jgi:hypothetical protein